MSRFVPVFLLALSLAPALPAAADAPVIVIVEHQDRDGQAVAKLLAQNLGNKVNFRPLDYSTENLGNPIYKGNLLASLSKARLVVSIGNASTGLVLAELEDTPVYFVGASLLKGAELKSGHIWGVLSYNPEDIFGAAPKHWTDKMGLVYTPGYEALAAAIRDAARKMGIVLRERRISRPNQLPAVLPSFFQAASSIWVLGDPILSRGASFEYIAEQSLTMGVPLIGTDVWEVENGAVFCSQAREPLLAERASESILSILATGNTNPRPRIDFAPEGGLIVYNRGLAMRYGLSSKPSLWVPVQ